MSLVTELSNFLLTILIFIALLVITVVVVDVNHEVICKKLVDFQRVEWFHTSV